MQTKDIEIEWNGKQEIVTLKRLTFGELNQVNEQSMEIKVVSGQPIVRVNQTAIKEIGLLKSITKAPFTIDINNIRDLDSAVGNMLFEEYTALNDQTPKKKD